MNRETFDQLQQAYANGGAEAAFAQLTETLRADQDYPALFNALLMRRRHELGMPLLAHQGFSDLDPATRQKYEEAYIAVCREIGGLYLAAGNIPQAWPFFRAIGEPGPVREAFARIESRENMEELIDIAFREGVDPRKGFEWILQYYGTCRAITNYEQLPTGSDKEACGGLLVKQLHQELLESLRYQIEQREGQGPDTRSVPELLQGRPWLLDDSYHIDVSHLAAVSRFSIELDDAEALRLAAEIADYGSRLPQTGLYGIDQSLHTQLHDCAMFLRALLGADVEGSLAHFRKKVADSSPDEVSRGPAQLLVCLLVRLKRLGEALDVSLNYLADVPPEALGFCPSTAQLCRMANDSQRLMEFARQRDDLLTFTAGLVGDPSG